MTISLPPETSSPPRLQPSGWLRYFSFSVDHKVIGLQYLVCGFVFYLIGGALAGAIRTELTSPVSDFMARDVYNQVLTLHGTVMIFRKSDKNESFWLTCCSTSCHNASKLVTENARLTFPHLM